MRFELKDYQEDAVAAVLRYLADAPDDWHRRETPVSLSLTATTGAGKTVMAAAVIEALFEGNPDFEFEADRSAVVLWFTDDPALNQQTRARLMEASDRLTSSRLETIENDFTQDKLEVGKVYFLNSQKLSKNAMLVRGAPVGGEQLSALGGSQPQLPGVDVPPDRRQHSFWDILRNTIEDDRLTLYLVLDEAHRGMKRRTKSDRAERETTVQRLINGTNGVPAVPIVWGISATVARFDEAMARAKGRLRYPAVIVDPARVQESGLLKDDIRLDFPTEVGRFDTVLLARATRKVVDTGKLWRDYAARQDPPAEPVVPLLVVQLPNKPSDDLLSATVSTIREAWPGLPFGAIAHVFGEHAPLTIGGEEVPHIGPEKVQDATYVQVLLAKDAVSTGWDCPRAEVLVSFRPAKDQTHITQLLGRMVRSPLKRRIPGDDRLNSVECLLPHFNRKTATEVAEVLLGKVDLEAGETGGGEGRRVLVAPVDMEPNATVSEQVWAAFDQLPSQTLPRRVAKPVRRLATLAQALAHDSLRPNAGREAYGELIAVLDGLSARFKDRIDEMENRILEVEGETLVASRAPAAEAVAERFMEIADDRSVEADFKTAGRVLSTPLAKKYAAHIAIETSEDDGLFDAYVKVAALARIDGVADELDRAADSLAREWQEKHRVAIKGLSDERRAVYDDIIAMSREPQRSDILRPHIRAESTQNEEGDLLDTRPDHLMSDPNGKFPIGSLNDWERQVVDTEMARKDALAWYRNPGRASEDALAIAYRDGSDNWRRMFPDFVFFHGDADDVRVSIIDPHGFHLSDALPKLRGLADYAKEYGDEIQRIESVAKMKDGSLRVLDLKDTTVQNTVYGAGDAEALYLDHAADRYL